MLALVARLAAFRRAALGPLDQRGRCAARDGRALCAGAGGARPRSRAASSRSPCARRRKRSGPSRRRFPAAAWAWRSASSAQASLDLSATRRCALRARDKGVTGFLLRLGTSGPSRARRSCASPSRRRRPATIGGFAAGIGRMAWRLQLEKNRLGPTGAFTVEWNSHERSFAERGAERRRATERRRGRPCAS